MATTTQYLEQLQADKQTLVDNLVAKGIEAMNEETFTTLVPKVANIETGGGDVFLDDINEIPTTANFTISSAYVTNEGIFIGGTRYGSQNMIIDLNTKEVINNNNNSIYFSPDTVLETNDYVFFSSNANTLPFGVFIKATNELKKSFTGSNNQMGGCKFFETSDGEVYGARGSSRSIIKFNFETEMFEDLQTISNSSNHSYIKFIELNDKSLILVFTYTNQCIYKKAPNETQFQKIEIDGFTDATALKYCWQYEDGLVCHNEKSSTSLWYIDFRDNTAHELVTGAHFSGMMVDKDVYGNYFLFTGDYYWKNMKQIRTIDTTTYTLSEPLNSEAISGLKEGYFKQIGNYKYSTGSIKDNISMTAVRIGNIKNGEVDVLGYINNTTGIFETEYGLMYTGTTIQLLKEGSSKLTTINSQINNNQINARKISIIDGKICAHRNSYEQGLFVYNPETQIFERTEYISLPGADILFTKGIYYGVATLGLDKWYIAKYNYSNDAIFSKNGRYGVNFSPYSVYVEKEASEKK